MVRKGTCLDIETVKERVINKGYTPLFTEYCKNTDKLLCETKEGYLGYVTNNGLMRGDSITVVSIKNPYTIHNINKYIENNNLGCELITKEWVSHKEHLLLKCPLCNKIYKCLWTTLRRKSDGLCPKCVIDKLSEEKRADIEKVYTDFYKRGYKPLFCEYFCNIQKLLVKDSSGYKGEMTYKQLLNGSGFYPFHPSNKYSINNIKLYLLNNGNTCEILSTKYTSNLELMNFKCECGIKYQTSLTSILRLNGLRCDVCNKRMSNLEHQVQLWLDDNNIKYKKQYRFKDCKNIYPLPFDFKLLIKNIIYVIEVNGIQHYQPQDFFGGEKTYNYQCNNDSIKKAYCDKNNIIYIEISYKDFPYNYKNILKSILLP